MDPRRLLLAAVLLVAVLAGLFALGMRTADDPPTLPAPPTAELPPPLAEADPTVVRGPVTAPTSAEADKDAASTPGLARLDAIAPTDARALLDLAREADRAHDHALALAAAERGIAAAAHFDALSVARDLDTLHKIRVIALEGLDAPRQEVRAAAAEWYAHNAAHERNTAWAEEICEAFGEPCEAAPE